MKYPDLLKEFAFETDAFQVGQGAMFTQKYDNERNKLFVLMLYASRSLDVAKRQYSITDLKAFFVVWEVKKFRLYVMSTHF